MFFLSDYICKLLELNKEPLQTWDNQRLYSSFAFGLVEELLEFNEVNEKMFTVADLKSLTKEAGDVLAYVVLVLIAQGLTSNQIAVEYYEHLESFSSPLAAASTMAGLFKRDFREHQIVPVAKVLFCLNTVLNELAPHEITLADIAEANLAKLTDRANRGVMFKGTGEDR